jgi:glycosyltransferase involved in cell wall biosynthesis
VKVALIVPGGVDRSGEYRVIPALLALIRRLADNHSVHVFALFQEPLPASWDLVGARIHNIGAAPVRIRAVRAICAENRRSPFDLIHSIWSGACGFVAVSAGWALRLPTLVHVTGGEAVRLPDIGFGGRITWRGRVQETVALRGATAVTATSAPLVQILAQLGVAAERLPLGVDLSSWPPQAPVRRNPREPARLIHVGSLNRVKDQPTLLRALAALVDAKVVFHMDIVGDDTLRGDVQALALSLGLADHVRFRGFLRQQELLPLVRAAHVMVMPSRHEAGPFAMLEAAVLGVPTVGTAVGHMAEWAPNGAIAVPVANPAELARAIRALLSDEDLRLQIGRDALNRATREDADYTARRFEAVYADLVRKRR